MGTRIEPTISHHPGAEPTIDGTVQVPLESENPELSAPPAHADAAADPTLAELAALENEVDNWLHPAPRSAPAAMETEPVQDEVREPPAPPAIQPAPVRRRKRPSAWWLAGAGALAAIAGAAVLLARPAADQPFDPAAAGTPVAAAPAATPAQAAIAPAPPPAAVKPEMVFLEQPPAAAEKPEKPAEPAAAEKPAEPKVAPAEPEAEPAVAPRPPVTVKKAVATANKPVKVKKAAARKKEKPEKQPIPAPALAQRTQTWPPDRRASDARRVEAARAECIARTRDPGACRIRVCDVLGSSHPACRE